MHRFSAIVTIILMFVTSNAIAQSTGEEGPIVVSERIQEIAMGYPLGQRLGIEWSDAKTDDIGRYLGLLSAAQTIAGEIAMKNGRETPDDVDLHAALISLCLWPNKPPLVEDTWSAQMAAFYSEKERILIREAVGEAAVQLAYTFAEIQRKLQGSSGALAVITGTPFEDAIGALPKDAEEYYSQVFNAPLVLDGQ